MLSLGGLINKKLMEKLLTIPPVFCQAGEICFPPSAVKVDEVLLTGKSQKVICPGGHTLMISREEVPWGVLGPRYRPKFTCQASNDTCK